MHEKDFTPFWPVTAPAPPQTEALREDINCDVVVVGAGFTGLRAALDLAESGSDVVVLEAGEIGHGASGRNGGQVNPMLPVQVPEDLRKAVGDRYFERMAEVSLQSADDLFDLIKSYQIPCEARRHGWLRVNHTEAMRVSAESAARAWNAHGADFEFLGAEDTRRLTGAPGYRSAVLSRRGGAVQPLALVRGLARVALSAGARIFSKSSVTTKKRTASGWELTANGHRVNAQVVIIATNGYTGALVPGLRSSIMPLISIQMGTDPLPDDKIASILPEGQTISDTRRLIMYARKEPGNQMLFGAIGFRRLNGGIGGINWMLRDAARVFPSLSGVSWRYFWGGQIAWTPERVPHLHEPEPGLLIGLGYNGRGVAMSMVMGRVLARRAMGAAPETLPFPVSAIRPFAFRNIQLMGAGLAMSWLKVRDQREWARG